MYLKKFDQRKPNDQREQSDNITLLMKCLNSVYLQMFHTTIY